MTTTRVANMAVGQNVTIPTTYNGTFTGTIVRMRELGQCAAEGEFMVTLTQGDGTTVEVRTSRLYSGYDNTPTNAVPAVHAKPCNAFGRGCGGVAVDGRCTICYAIS